MIVTAVLKEHGDKGARRCTKLNEAELCYHVQREELRDMIASSSAPTKPSSIQKSRSERACAATPPELTRKLRR